MAQRDLDDLAMCQAVPARATEDMESDASVTWPFGKF